MVVAEPALVPWHQAKQVHSCTFLQCLPLHLPLFPKSLHSVNIEISDKTIPETLKMNERVALIEARILSTAAGRLGVRIAVQLQMDFL